MASPTRKVAAGTVALALALEGVSLVPYRDIGGVWTIGAGHTGPDVTAATPRITEQRARQLAEGDLQKAQAAVLSCLAADPTDNELAAFTLMTYNTGPGKPGVKDGFCWLKDGRPSTLVRRFNAGDRLGACLAMLAWVNVGRTYSQGLFNRRWTEYQLCIA